MISKKWLVQITESSIDNLIRTFTRMAYFFYTENDLHTCLYHEIYSKLPLEEWQCTTKDGKTSILLHKEYPTKMRYVAETLEENAPKGTKGHFDLAIWNPEKALERLFRVNQSADFMQEQQTFIAIEFNLTERSASLKDAVHHFKRDLMKLSSNNEVEHGYQLVFVRDWLYGKRFLQEIQDEVASARRKRLKNLQNLFRIRCFNNYFAETRLNPNFNPAHFIPLPTPNASFSAKTKQFGDSARSPNIWASSITTD